ncbi:MAG: hypothetical protein JWQ87_5445 [Candidatus Sulfotelmatobacter sp.]|nr:hypothetical protein [Candidatus Sulfotelmatobacter sp.]
MKRIFQALAVLWLLSIVSVAQLNPPQLTPFQPFQMPPYPQLAGFRVQVATGKINIGSTTTVIPATTIYVNPNSVTYIFLNVTTGIVQSNNGGFGAGIYPIAVATSNSTYVYSLVDSRPDVFNNGGSGGGGTGTVTGPLSAVVPNIVCWTSPAGITIGDCGYAFPLSNAALANSTLTLNTGSGLTGGNAVSLGGTLTFSLLTTCSNGQVLQWNGSAWVCATNGTITGVTAGLGLTGGGSSGSPTLSLLTSCGSGQVLQWNGSTWVCASITATPGGATTQVQYNNAGALAGDSTFLFNSSTHTLTVQNFVFTGTFSAAQPYQMVTSIPVSPLSTGSVGSSGININTDGFFCMWVNGGACNDLSTTGGSSIVPSPAGAQSITQPGGTTFSSNDFAGIKYAVNSYNWLQNPAGTITVGANTITLTPCPIGIFVNTPIFYGGSTTPTYVYISAVGTPETALITSTTCTQAGGANGTITFTAANTHAAGYAIGSASQGLQETINAAPYTGIYGTGGMELGATVIPPGAYTLRARVTVTSPGQVVDFSGSNVTCLMADSCLFVGSTTFPNYAWDIKISNFMGIPGCNNCNFPMIEDAGQHTQFLNIKSANPNPVGSKTSGLSFGSLIQVDNDQSTVIDALDTGNARWSHCDTTFCSVAVKGAGGGGNSGIIYLKNSAMNLGCSANGVDNQNGNTMRISDTVIQSQTQFGVRSTATYGNIPNVELDNVYWEVAGCANTNPLHVGIAGLIVVGGFSSVKNNVGPTGSLEVFVNSGTTGSTQYNYYIIAHSTSSGGIVSPAYLIGICLTNGTAGTCTVKWPQFGSSGTVTYDVVRTSGQANNPAPYLAICGGGSPTACGTVATALTTGAACSTVGTAHICSFADSMTANTVAATSGSFPASPTYYPSFGDGSGAGVFWPGAVINANGADGLPGTAPGPSGVHFDQIGKNVGNSALNPVNQLVDVYGPLLPHFFAQHCDGGIYGGAWVSCVETSTGAAAGTAVNGATLLESGLYNGAEAFGYKGRLIFEQGLANLVNGGHKVTLVDSNPIKTLNTITMRAAYDANDTYIGLDNVSGAVAPTLAQLAFGAPVSISNYIGNAGDNTSWLERLTASLKTFTVPVTLLGAGANLTVGGTSLHTGAATFNGTVQMNAALASISSVGIQGNLTAYRQALAKTTNFSVTNAFSGTFFTNNGAAGTVIFTLPVCSTNGLNYSFYIDAAQTLEILAVSGAKFRNLATLGAANGNIQASTQGNAIHIQCIGTSTADGVAEWVVDTINGTWSIN